MNAASNPLDFTFAGPGLPIGLGSGLDAAQLALWKAGVLWNTRVLEAASDAVRQDPEPDKTPQPVPEPDRIPDRQR